MCSNEDDEEGYSPKDPSQHSVMIAPHLALISHVVHAP